MEEARNAMYVPPGPTAADKQAKKAERKAQREARKSEADAEILALVAASEAKDIEIEKLKGE